MIILSNKRVVTAFMMTLALCALFLSSGKAAAPQSLGQETSLTATQSSENASKQDIQWFKDQMRISDKYREKHEGIFGISWIHFFVMIFLILFGIGALVMFAVKQKRLKVILTDIQKEVEDDDES